MVWEKCEAGRWIPTEAAGMVFLNPGLQKVTPRGAFFLLFIALVHFVTVFIGLWAKNEVRPDAALMLKEPQQLLQVSLLVFPCRQS
jgi:hypothetical protein